MILIRLLLRNLKSRQLLSINHTQALQLILAGAGTGKTTTISAKIAYMIEKENIDPPRYLPSPSQRRNREFAGISKTFSRN
ncbi:MAG TPA: UvrD-helicase domain-containing protein [candidate division Zixibacteria bacterium]|nr:UvrD-helicase domain-containing protein [candidate division Zixibacteria bacterium]